MHDNTNITCHECEKEITVDDIENLEYIIGFNSGYYHKNCYLGNGGLLDSLIRSIGPLMKALMPNELKNHLVKEQRIKETIKSRPIKEGHNEET